MAKGDTLVFSAVGTEESRKAFEQEGMIIAVTERCYPHNHVWVRAAESGRRKASKRLLQQFQQKEKGPELGRLQQNQKVRDGGCISQCLSAASEKKKIQLV